MKYLTNHWSKPWVKASGVKPTVKRRGVHNTIRHIADAIGQDWGAGAAFVATGWREAKLLNGLFGKPAGVA